MTIKDAGDELKVEDFFWRKFLAALLVFSFSQRLTFQPREELSFPQSCAAGEDFKKATASHRYAHSRVSPKFLLSFSSWDTLPENSLQRCPCQQVGKLNQKRIRGRLRLYQLALLLLFLLWHLFTLISLRHSIYPPPAPLLPPPSLLPASDNVTFCQSAGNHATVAAGSSVAATEIDSNKCRERKSERGREIRRREEEEKTRAKGERKERRRRREKKENGEQDS